MVVEPRDAELTYRCMRAVHFESGRPWPPIDAMRSDGRWNGSNQAAIYSSHEEAVAIAEKRRHIGQHVDELRVAFELWTGHSWGMIRLLVVAFSSLGPWLGDVGWTYDGRKVLGAWGSFAPFMSAGPADGQPFGYLAPQKRSRQLADIGATRLIVPSYPFFVGRPPELRWNSVFLIGSEGQPGVGDLPDPVAVGISFEVLVPGDS